MREFGYWLGAGLLVAGGATALAELLTVLQGAPLTLSIGAIWFRIHANSLVGFQALIEKGLTLLFWPPIQWLLTCRPGWCWCRPASCWWCSAVRGRVPEPAQTIKGALSPPS